MRVLPLDARPRSDRLRSGGCESDFLAVGEFVNSYVLVKMKVFSAGRHLWKRTTGSTIFGAAVDSLVFCPIAFLGAWPLEQVVNVMIGNYFIKVLWEVLATPCTYKVVGFLKKAEQEDFYDKETNFNPFTLETQETGTMPLAPIARSAF